LTAKNFVAINGNRGAQQDSVSIKVSKEIVPFQQARVRFPNLGVRSKKTIQLDFRSRRRINNPTPPKKLRLRYCGAEMNVFVCFKSEPDVTILFQNQIQIEDDLNASKDSAKAERWLMTKAQTSCNDMYDDPIS